MNSIKPLRYLLTAVILAGGMILKAQDTEALKEMQLTLQQVIDMARDQSPDALVAKNRLNNNYWRYRSFRADQLPQLSLNGTLPDLNRTISSTILDDGTAGFIESSNVNSSVNLSLSQQLGVTGTPIAVTSGLQRIDVLEPTSSFSYLATPVVVNLTQPLFSFNSFYWRQKIAPLEYEEAQRAYQESLEEVSITASNHFFDLYLAQINIQIAKVNKANNDTLYRIAKGRYNLGKISEDELLQMELSVLNSDNDLAQARLDVENALFRLKTFLGVREQVRIALLSPDEVPELEVDVQKALEQARQNRQKVIELDRRLLEADRDVAQAKGDNDLNMNLFASFGLTKRATEVPELYIDPQDQERVRVGVQVPILDWGKSKANVKMAQATRQLVQTTVEQEAINFEQEIYLKVNEFNMQNTQLLIAAKSDTIAQKRFEVAKHRYYIGKIDITDLNIALREKDIAKRGYVQALRRYWREYYDIRRLTLYDFEADRPIVPQYQFGKDGVY